MIEIFINTVDGIVLTFVQGSFGSLTGSIQTLWRLMFVLFIAVYGYKILISGRFHAGDLLVHIVKIIIILIVATQWGAFSFLVYDITTDLPSDIAGQIMLGTSNVFTDPAATDVVSANSALTNFYDRAMEVSEKVLEGAKWNSFGLYFYAFAIWAGAIAFAGYAAMLIILAKLSVAILLAVGPLFILLLIFANTKSLFEGWLRTLLNYAIIPIFVYLLLALLLTLAEAPLVLMENNSGSNGDFITSIGAFFFICFVSLLLLAQIMNMAGSITGGLTLSTMGVATFGFRVAGRAAGHASAPAAQAVGRAGIKVTKSAGKATANKTRQGMSALKQTLRNRTKSI